MSEDRTPVEVAAEAVNRLPGATWLNGRRAVKVAFGSVDVDGMAGVLNDHPSIPWKSSPTGFICPTCRNDTIAGPNSPTHATHQAEAVKAWMTGGGA